MNIEIWQIHIQDLLDAFESIFELLDMVTPNLFMQDHERVAAIANLLGVIGEITHQIPPPIQKKFPEVAWAKLQNLTQTHGLTPQTADPKKIWMTVQNELIGSYQQIMNLQHIRQS